MMKINVAVGFLAVALNLFFVPHVLADQSALHWLDRMSHSVRESNYYGVYSHTENSKMQSLRLVHAVKDNMEYERLVYLDGDQREVIRDGHPLHCIHPGEEMLRFGGQQPVAKGGSVRLEDYYSLTMQKDAGRIAGLSVVKIDVLPKDPYRFGYRYYLDHVSALPIKFQLLSTDGAVIEQYQFSEITIGGDIPENLLAASSNSAYHPSHPNEFSMDYSADYTWVVNWLPDGFVQVTSSATSASLQSITYTDGMAMFSVFVAADAADIRGDEAAFKDGSTVGVSRTLHLDGVEHNVTVMGEVPELTAKKVAKSVVSLAQAGNGQSE